MAKRVGIVGAAGQLGRDLVRVLGAPPALAPPHSEVDLTAPETLRRWLDATRPDWVVSSAACHDVERCESDVKLALAVNAEGALALARETALRGIGLLWVSTDYVFSGAKGSPYLESDLPGPVNVYGASKLAGEALVRAANPRSLVVRTSALYGHHPCRGKRALSFVELMRKLGRERGRVRVVDDETTSPTYTRELAASIRSALEQELAGLLHLAGSGACTWYEFACAIFELAGLDVKVERAEPGEFPKKAPRPAFSALASERAAAAAGLALPPWRAGLRAYLAERPGA